MDSERFFPRQGARGTLGPLGFATEDSIVIGTVGRMAAVKDPLTLVQAFLHLLTKEPGARERIRLVLVGDGALRAKVQQRVRDSGGEDLVWLPGERSDVAKIMRALDIFVLPSLGEGISNTILEAMSSGLPVVATHVGGNPELVVEGETGFLVPPADPVAVADALRVYLCNPELMRHHGRAGRVRVEAGFSLDTMVQGYLAVYDAVLGHSLSNGSSGARPEIDHFGIETEPDHVRHRRHL